MCVAASPRVAEMRDGTRGVATGATKGQRLLAVTVDTKSAVSGDKEVRHGCVGRDEPAVRKPKAVTR